MIWVGITWGSQGSMQNRWNVNASPSAQSLRASGTISGIDQTQQGSLRSEHDDKNRIGLNMIFWSLIWCVLLIRPYESPKLQSTLRRVPSQSCGKRSCLAFIQSIWGFSSIFLEWKVKGGWMPIEIQVQVWPGVMSSPLSPCPSHWHPVTCSPA